MLSLSTLTDSTKIINLSGTLPHGWDPMRPQFYAVVPDENQVHTVDLGTIEDSELDEFGDRSCEHSDCSGYVMSDLSGQAVITPSTIATNFRTITLPGCVEVMTGKARTRSLSHLVVKGAIIHDDCVIKRHQLDSSDDTEGFHIFRSRYISDDTVYVYSAYTRRDIRRSTGRITYSVTREDLYLYVTSDWRHARSYYAVAYAQKYNEFAGLDACLEMARKATPTQWDWNTRAYRLSGYGTTHRNYDAVIADLRLRVSSDVFPPKLVEEPEHLWGDLCQEAISDAHYVDINSLSFSKEILTLGTTIRSLVSTISDLRKPKRWADLFLSSRYGLTLTAKDGKELLDRIYSLKRGRLPKHTSVRSMKRSVSVNETIAPPSQWEAHYKIYYEPYTSGAMGVMKTLLDWDVYPTLQNCWDWVPFSFVVDWFVDVESLLTRIDTHLYSAYLRCLGTLKSWKCIQYVDASMIIPGSFGNVELKYYSRSRSKTMDLPPLRLDTPKEFRNYAELSAIIVQKVR